MSKRIHKTLSLDPDITKKYENIMKLKGKTSSKDIQEHMQRVNEECDKEQSVTAAKQLDLSPTANVYHDDYIEERINFESYLQ